MNLAYEKLLLLSMHTPHLATGAAGDRSCHPTRGCHIRLALIQSLGDRWQRHLTLSSLTCLFTAASTVIPGASPVSTHTVHTAGSLLS